ncbi:MAG: efflux RND transporter periplasmic adaptor subunit [Candidatus Wallbacteria bacterium]|nr:efflux RND transporter periplasmic adaptor subunit [Candidatus Wallbacteria bacterium]
MSRGKLIAALVAVLLTGWLGYSKFVKKSEQKVVYRTAKVERGDLVATVSATGTLNAVTTVQVGSQLSGIIMRLHADFNSQVKSGQLLAELDPATFAASVAQGKADVDAAQTAIQAATTDLKILDAEVGAARAGIATARANLAKAEVALVDRDLILKRTRALRSKAFAAEQDLDTAQANRNTAAAEVEAAKAGLENAKAKLETAQAQRTNGDSKVATAKAQLAQKQASLELARVNLGRTRILSPIDGVVVSRNVDVGQTVAASLQAPVLFTIANDLRRMQIDANVDEADIGRVKLGQTVEFTVDAYPDDRFDGKVVQMRLQPIVSQNVVTYDTVIEVANEAMLLRPGMTASVRIQIASVKGALKVASGAFGYRPAPPPGKPPAAPPPLAKGKRRLHVPRDGKAEPLEVAIGIADGTSTELLDKQLAEGDAVIVGDDGESEAGPSGPTNPFAPRRR